MLPTPVPQTDTVDTSTMETKEEEETSRAGDMPVWLTVSVKMSAEHTTGSQLGECLAGRRTL